MLFMWKTTGTDSSKLHTIKYESKVGTLRSSVSWLSMKASVALQFLERNSIK